MPKCRGSLKPFTCRIEADDWNYIWTVGRGKNFNAALRYFVHIIRYLEAEGLAEIRGYFEPKEWKFMADVLKDRNEPVWEKNELIRAVMEIRHMEAKTSYYGVEPAALCDKIRQLNSIHVLALTERVYQFWHRSELVKMDEWARY